LDQGLALEKGYDPGLAWLEPAAGSFQPVDEVNYKTGAVYGGEVVDRETAEHTEAGAKPPRVKAVSPAEPDIKPEADARGKVGPKVNRPEAGEKRSFFERLFGPKKDPAPKPSSPPAGANPR
jgi:hypothetical protein